MRWERRTQWCGQGRAGGFTLFESLIVLAIGVAVIGGIMFVMQANERAERRDNATRVQGQEMATIAKAARQWADTEGENWADGSRNEVSVDDLIDNGLLPEGFGDRDSGGSGALGITPTGQSYTIVSIKNGPSGSLYHDPTVDEGKVRTVIWDEGTPVAGRLERIGVQNVVGAITAWKEAVSLYASNEYGIPMGVLVVGSGDVRGVGRSFTKDVIDWIEDPVTQPAAVALVGFPDLEGDGGGGTGPTGPAVTQYEDCQVIEDMEGCGGGGMGSSCPWWDPPACPTGYDELAQPRVCGTAGQTVRSTDVGMMVSGSTQVRETSGVQWPGTCDYGQTDTTWATVSVGGSEIYRTQCAVLQQQQGWQQGPPPNYQQVCTTQTSSGVVPTTSMSGTHGLLCCRPAPSSN